MVRFTYNLQVIIGTFICINTTIASEALDGREIAKKNLCLGCHAETKKVVGPAFIEIAKKYDNSTATHIYLADKIKNGGVGAWGAIPMPANKNTISDKEVNLVIQWMFSLRR